VAEPFNPEAFRQQMAQGQTPTIPAPVPAPAPAIPQPPMPPAQHSHPHPHIQQPHVHQSQVPQPQTPQPPHPQVPQPGAYTAAPTPQNPPMQHPQHGQAQQGHVPQPYQHQPFQQPSPQAGQQAYAPPPGQPFQAPHMPSQAIEAPKAKRSLFKRKALKEAAAGQISGPIEPMQANINQLGGMPANAARGLSRSVVFAAGLAMGVLGSLVAIMLFSGNEPQQANVVHSLNPDSISTQAYDGSSQSALTDEMLTKDQDG